VARSVPLENGKVIKTLPTNTVYHECWCGAPTVLALFLTYG
jgi:hypothetical protein